MYLKLFLCTSCQSYNYTKDELDYMILINPFDVLFWTLRRSERDVIRLYDAMSPLMQLTTGGNMLNFGYWDDEHVDPQSAQTNMCKYFGEYAGLDTAKRVLDVGSGLSAPAHIWQSMYDIDLVCLNINYTQLHKGRSNSIDHLNASATELPFDSNTFDRILALESAQHFRPLSEFLAQSKQILTSSGLFVMAIPITLDSITSMKLGILHLTWSSEHYSLQTVEELIERSGFVIKDSHLIGSSVYVPLADYYIKNRTRLKDIVLTNYSSVVERLLYWSLVKMRSATNSRVIDYLLIKCHK